MIPTKDQIRTLALQAGFKLKLQPDGTEDLNPYVYDFAQALLTFEAPCELLPPCVCYGELAEKFCIRQRKCSKAEAQ